MLYSLYETPVPQKFVLRPFNSDMLLNSIKKTEARMLI